MMEYKLKILRPHCSDCMACEGCYIGSQACNIVMDKDFCDRQDKACKRWTWE